MEQKNCMSYLDIAYHSVLWFACDAADHIILANSMEGSVPSFVAEEKERTEKIASMLCNLKAVDRNRGAPIDYQELADKGYYCFLNDDYDGECYSLYAEPTKPIYLYEFDDEVRQYLQKQKLPINVENTKSFTIDLCGHVREI